MDLLGGPVSDQHAGLAVPGKLPMAEGAEFFPVEAPGLFFKFYKVTKNIKCRDAGKKVNPAVKRKHAPNNIRYEQKTGDGDDPLGG
ncbi:MAG: hypothetical protein ACU84H_13730 [Gammaproteobacteria bacterium]